MLICRYLSNDRRPSAAAGPVHPATTTVLEFLWTARHAANRSSKAIHSIVFSCLPLRQPTIRRDYFASQGGLFRLGVAAGNPHPWPAPCKGDARTANPRQSLWLCRAKRHRNRSNGCFDRALRRRFAADDRLASIPSQSRGNLPRPLFKRDRSRAGTQQVALCLSLNSLASSTPLRRRRHAVETMRSTRRCSSSPNGANCVRRRSPKARRSAWRSPLTRTSRLRSPCLVPLSGTTALPAEVFGHSQASRARQQHHAATVDALSVGVIASLRAPMRD